MFNKRAVNNIFLCGCLSMMIQLHFAGSNQTNATISFKSSFNKTNLISRPKNDTLMIESQRVETANKIKTPSEFAKVFTSKLKKQHEKIKNATDTSKALLPSLWKSPPMLGLSGQIFLDSLGALISKHGKDINALENSRYNFFSKKKPVDDYYDIPDPIDFSEGPEISHKRRDLGEQKTYDPSGVDLALHHEYGPEDLVYEYDYDSTPLEADDVTTEFFADDTTPLFEETTSSPLNDEVNTNPPLDTVTPFYENMQVTKTPPKPFREKDFNDDWTDIVDDMDENEDDIDVSFDGASTASSKPMRPKPRPRNKIPNLFRQKYHFIGGTPRYPPGDPDKLYSDGLLLYHKEEYIL